MGRWTVDEGANVHAVRRRGHVAANVTVNVRRQGHVALAGPQDALRKGGLSPPYAYLLRRSPTYLLCLSPTHISYLLRLSPTYISYASLLCLPPHTPTAVHRARRVRIRAWGTNLGLKGTEFQRY
eukprot:773429-Rhodomonas_salina.1